MAATPSSTRPQDRAERINAMCIQRAEQLIGQFGPPVGATTEREARLDVERATAATEASLLKGYIHSLCREVANLERYLGAAALTCTTSYYGRPVLLGYRVESDEDPSGRVRPLVVLETVNGLDACLCDPGMCETWEKACERAWRDDCEQAKVDAAAPESRLAA